MSKESVTSDLFDRWELVWHEDRHDLVPSCVGPTYIRHEATGDRTVTAESYAAELTKMKEARSPQQSLSIGKVANRGGPQDTDPINGVI